MFLVIKLGGGGFLPSGLEVRCRSSASDFSGLEAARIDLVMSATKILVPLPRLICTESRKWLLFCRAGCLTKCPTTPQGRPVEAALMHPDVVVGTSLSTC